MSQESVTQLDAECWLPVMMHAWACMCRLWKQAYYNASNCEALVSCAAELQGLVLANISLAARPTLMANLLEAVTEVKEFIATFSERSVPLIVLSA